MRNSYCTGEEGRRGFEEEERRRRGVELVEAARAAGAGEDDERGESLVSRKRKADGEVLQIKGEKRSRTEEP